MRVFLALPVPEVMIQSLFTVAEKIKRVSPSLRVPKIEGLHFTLFFFGEKVPEEVQNITTVLNSSVLDIPHITARFKGLGTFPPGGIPRVLYADLSEGGEEIIGLQARLGLVLKQGDVAVPDEKRPFQPHLTLARNKGGFIDRKLLDGILLPPGPFILDRCVLFQSVLEKDGAVYQPLASRMLAG